MGSRKVFTHAQDATAAVKFLEWGKLLEVAAPHGQECDEIVKAIQQNQASYIHFNKQTFPLIDAVVIKVNPVEVYALQFTVVADHSYDYQGRVRLETSIGKALHRNFVFDEFCFVVKPNVVPTFIANRSIRNKKKAKIRTVCVAAFHV